MRAALLSFALIASLVACSSAEESSTDSAGAELNAAPACAPLRVCTPANLDFKTRDWRHGLTSTLVTHLGDAHHRGRDMFVNPGAAQWVVGKFAYGIADKDLHGEDVDIFVERECGQAWEKLGTATTTDDGEHAEVEGVEDNGGRIYFQIPAEKALGPGRHRLRLVVAGDGTSADSFIDVVPPDTKIVVSDVDGTLTSSEHIEFADLLIGKTPQTHPGAPEALSELAAKGYRIMYLTARPELLTQRTRDFLDERGFPPGLVHTSTETLGAGSGAGAADYKTKELALLAGKGLHPTYGFGNKSTDSQAYATVVADPQNRIFYQISGEYTGRNIQSYEELVPGFAALDVVCR